MEISKVGMNFLYIILLVVFPHSVLANVDPKNVRCLVCQKVVEEIDSAIQKVDPKRTVEIGSYRLDSTGNQRQVLYARSEMYLTEVLETVCSKMDDYIRATYKTSGELTLLRLIGPDGKMNPDLSRVDIVQDSDLNKSLKFYCEGIVEVFEENILRLFGTDADNIDIKLCSSEAKLCSHMESDTKDYEFEDRDEL